MTPAEKKVEATRAKKDQKFSNDMQSEIDIFNKGSAYWTSIIERGKAQGVIGYSEEKALKNAIKYCNLEYLSLKQSQVKDIIKAVAMLNENGIE